MLLQLTCCNTDNEKRSLSPKTALFLNITFKACYTPILTWKKEVERPFTPNFLPLSWLSCS